MTEGIGAWTTAVHEGDAFDLLDELPENSVHAVVTDPPYGLAFMGRDWDDFEPREYQEWCEEWAREAKQVLRPGGHLLAFSGNRTHHRLFSGVEDAGFEIRDTVTWHYGSGFPKALDVSKAIDKAAGAEREIVGDHPKPARNEPGGNSLNISKNGMPDTADITAPATDAAERWDGFKTALKPATEFVVLARVPLDGTVAENVQEWGTGALNIGDCRIGTDEDTTRPSGPDNPEIYGEQGEGVRGSIDKGRYPANVVFDERAAAALDRAVGDTASGDGQLTRNKDVDSGDPDIHDGYDRPNKTMFADDEPEGIRSYGDSGGPSRYFYTSKATRAERTLDGKIDNAHPTVKPADLMEWLVRLVTREGQIVLDPFAGSGTTLAAAKDLGREFVGFEQDAQWCDVARVRTGLTPEDPATVRADDEQQGLEAFADGGSFQQN